MRPTDIETLVSVGRPSIAADGSFAVFAASRPDVAANRAVGQVWRVDLPEGRPRRLTRGIADTAPQLSPDSRRLAFLRADRRGTVQVWVTDAAGGEPIQATDAPTSVSDVSWSPDGSRLAYVARVPEPGRYGTVDGLSAEAESPRRITGVRWHSNGLGYSGDRPAQLFVVAAPDPRAEPFYPPAPRFAPEGEDTPAERIVSAEAVQVTDGPASWRGTTWTPDGRGLLVLPDTIETDRRDLRDRLVSVPADGGEPEEIVGRDAGIAIDDVAVGPDGTVYLIAAPVGASGIDFVAPQSSLWVLGSDGVRQVTAPDAVDLGEPGTRIVVRDNDVLVRDRTRGRVRVVSIGRDGSVAEVLGGDVEVGDLDAAAGRIVVSMGDPSSFGELELLEHGTRHRLSDFGAGVRERGVVAPRKLQIAGRDGYPVHGWVATPAGDGPFPVILQIHGGPFAAYGVRLFDETQVLVDAGYAVVYGNPRGSAGYGHAHGRAIRQAMGSVDLTDVLDLLDAAVASDPRLDGDRTGIMGGSYGGYLTAWAIAHDHRFAGAIVERGFLDPISFQGTSDIGSFFGDEYVGVDPDLIARQSPMAVVDRVRTPTLVIHSELDYRCPLEQATRYYSALRRGGVEAELLVFPGEDHELSRAGQPRHRVERFDAILDWWRRRLPVDR